MKKLLLIFVSFVVSIGFAAGAVLYVPSAAYSTIQAAIDAAFPGDVIQVAAGNYIESLTVNKNSLTIIGAGPTKTIIKTRNINPAIILSANYFVLKDLKITNNTKAKECIRVISPASIGLTVDQVYFTNLDNGIDIAYGINILTSMDDVIVKNSRFVANMAASRAIGIYGGRNLVQHNWLVESTEFANLYVGIYLNSTVLDLLVKTNVFGPWDLSDCKQAASGLYIGDGGASFNIHNVTVTGNNFTSYARGVYFLNNSANQIVGNTVITGNTFTNSIYSSGIRIVAGTQEFGVYSPSVLEGPVYVNSNNFTQNHKIVNGSGVSMIDFRTVTGGESPTSVINVIGNSITFAGPFDVSTWCVLLRGPITHAEVLGNTFTGNGAGGISPNMPPTSAVCVQTNYLDYGPTATNSIFNINNNSITGFVNGISVYDMLYKVYGNLPIGAVITANNNAILGNAYGIYSGAGERTNARYNWWGTSGGPYGAISDYVDFIPWWCDASMTTICPEANINVSGIVNDLETVCYSAYEVITVAGLPNTFLVKSGGNVTMIAGQKILYYPGTKVEPGGYMHGYIAPSGPFCMPTDAANSPTGDPEVSFSSNEDIIFKVYPNPTNGNFTIVQRGDKLFENVTMAIYNMRGERMMSRELSGQNSYSFSATSYPIGFYFIRLVANDKVETIKLIKTN